MPYRPLVARTALCRNQRICFTVYGRTLPSERMPIISNNPSKFSSLMHRRGQHAWFAHVPQCDDSSSEQALSLSLQLRPSTNAAGPAHVHSPRGTRHVTRGDGSNGHGPRSRRRENGKQAGQGRKYIAMQHNSFRAAAPCIAPLRQVQHAAEDARITHYLPASYNVLFIQLSRGLPSGLAPSTRTREDTAAGQLDSHTAHSATHGTSSCTSMHHGVPPQPQGGAGRAPYAFPYFNLAKHKAVEL